MAIGAAAFAVSPPQDFYQPFDANGPSRLYAAKRCGTAFS
jgi:hypothetical protein